MIVRFSIACFLLFGFFSSQQSNPQILQQNFTTFWTYFNTLDFSANFKAFDENKTSISKELFFHKMESGKFIPITDNNIPNTYYLSPLSSSAPSNIGETVQYFAQAELKKLKKENTLFPKFRLVDIYGKVWTSENTKGKIVALKFWFIHCPGCIEEFPEVNRISEEYKDKVIFLSLSFDSKTQLLSFLKKKKLNYNTISVSQKYINHELGISEFPTHVILNQEGRIYKVVNSAKQLDNRLKEIIN